MVESRKPGNPRRFERAWTGLGTAHRNLSRSLEDLGTEVRELPEDRPWEAPANGDLVVLSSDFRGYDPFLLCMRLKQRRDVWISVVLLAPEEDQSLVAPLAQFCMSDGILLAPPGEAGVASFDLLSEVLEHPKPKVSTDELLTELEGRMGGKARALADRVLSGLSQERGRSFVESVTDPQTGLFDNPFMAFKLEEEFKRSWRFKQPLTVLLLDLPGARAAGEGDRSRILGEVSGLLLNESRDIDFLGRYDESSFLLLLPHTGMMGAKVLANRILGRLEDREKLAPAVAIVTVPKTGIEKKDDLLDLVRMTLVSAWSAEGEDRIQVAH